MAALATRPDLLLDLFVSNKASSVGIYTFQLYKHGCWHQIVIDNLMPFHKSGKQIFNCLRPKFQCHNLFMYLNVARRFLTECVLLCREGPACCVILVKRESTGTVACAHFEGIRKATWRIFGTYKREHPRSSCRFNRRGVRKMEA